MQTRLLGHLDGTIGLKTAAAEGKKTALPRSERDGRQAITGGPRKEAGQA
jgi:hypothetical protein